MQSSSNCSSKMDGLKNFMLYTMEHESSEPACIGPVSLYGSSTDQVTNFANVRDTLQKNEILDWDFDFWDSTFRCRVSWKLEKVNVLEKTGAEVL
jgi:hypothetical protein